MRRRRNGERGVALLLTMFALMIVTAIGFSMMFQTDTETAINSNFRDQQAAYYAAAAGLEEARDRMDSLSAAPISAPDRRRTVVNESAAETGLWILLAARRWHVRP